MELFIPFQSRSPVMQPFTARIPDADLAGLRRRLAETRWAPEQPVGAEDGAYGVPLSRVRRLVARWQDFDWRGWEDRLNAYPQFRTEIDGQPVHFLHARSSMAGALPVVLTHGWPGSVFEYIDLVGRLVDPAGHGADPADAFHVVLPSLPGYGFSGPALKPGWGTRRIAAAWAELMDRLGYERYGAIGNDAGSMISPELGRQAPGHYEDTHQPADAQAGPTTVPIGLAAAAAGDFRSIRRFAERDHTRITSWTELPGVTGHYSAYTSPDELARDIRRFFRPLRTAAGLAASKEN
jgi:hypothetical protein